MRIDLLSAGFLAFVVFTSIPLASGTTTEHMHVTRNLVHLLIVCGLVYFKL